MGSSPLSLAQNSFVCLLINNWMLGGNDAKVWRADKASFRTKINQSKFHSHLSNPLLNSVSLRILLNWINISKNLSKRPSRQATQKKPSMCVKSIHGWNVNCSLCVYFLIRIRFTCSQCRIPVPWQAEKNHEEWHAHTHTHNVVYHFLQWFYCKLKKKITMNHASKKIKTAKQSTVTAVGIERSWNVDLFSTVFCL